MARQTLRQALTQKKPVIARHLATKRTNKNRHWPDLEGNIKFWHDFNITTLNAQFGDMLNEYLPESLSVPQADEELPNISINGDKDIKKVIAWNSKILEPTLDFGRSSLGLHPGLTLAHEHLKPTVPGDQRARVDHLVSLEDSPSRFLLAGLGITSSKFKVSELLASIHQVGTSTSKSQNAQNPVRQLANTCNKANVRYGYIQTDNELVACRFTCTAEGWEASVRSFPMSMHGENNLTADLALWWLAMLALPHEGGSAITPISEMPQERGSAVAPSDEMPQERGSPIAPRGEPQQDRSVATGRNVVNRSPEASINHPVLNFYL